MTIIKMKDTKKPVYMFFTDSEDKSLLVDFQWEEIAIERMSIYEDRVEKLSKELINPGTEIKDDIDIALFMDELEQCIKIMEKEKKNIEKEIRNIQDEYWYERTAMHRTPFMPANYKEMKEMDKKLKEYQEAETSVSNKVKLLRERVWKI